MKVKIKMIKNKELIEFKKLKYLKAKIKIIKKGNYYLNFKYFVFYVLKFQSKFTNKLSSFTQYIYYWIKKKNLLYGHNIFIDFIGFTSLTLFDFIKSIYFS